MNPLIRVWRRWSMTPAMIGFTRWRVFVRWHLDGRPVPPPHVVKQRVVLDYQRRYRLRTFVETGTFTGEMVHAVRHRFDEIVSIELAEPLYRAAKARFADDGHIRLLQGDSAVVLPSVLATLGRPALFWLDGHFMGSGTGRGDQDTPIASEMRAILRHPVRGHVVLVDDARLFTGEHGYPTIEQFASLVQTARPGTTVEIGADIIRCVFDAGPIPAVVRTGEFAYS